MDSSLTFCEPFSPVFGGLFILLNLFIMMSPLFSAAFFPSLSPACEIPDSNAFFAMGLANLLKKNFVGLKILAELRTPEACVRSPIAKRIW